MSDITMCTNEECHRNIWCYRFTAIPNPHRQSYGEFTWDEEADECDGWWDNSEYEKEQS